jgi:hypothetical protein
MNSRLSSMTLHFPFGALLLVVGAVKLLENMELIKETSLGRCAVLTIVFVGLVHLWSPGRTLRCRENLWLCLAALWACLSVAQTPGFAVGESWPLLVAVLAAVSVWDSVCARPPRRA